MSYLKFFFWKYYFGHTTFWYSSRCTSGHLQSFVLISDVLPTFSSLKANKNWRKRSLILQCSFARTTSLILRTSTHLTLKITCCRNTAKNLSDFKNFPADMFLLGIREDIYTAPFLDAQELHFWSTLKANVCIFLYISVRNFFSQRRSNILFDCGGFGEGWMIPEGDSLFGSRKKFYNFSFWLKSF